jgi:4-hydroxy-3-methylbut-2-enyl diphosphate reductase
VDDTAEIVAALQRRFPDIAAPYKEDICYATTNRQEAVKAIAPRCDLILVLGAPNSSNSVRLVEVAKRAGAREALLVESAADVDWSRFQNVRTLGVTAGASAPEDLVEALIAACRERFEVVQDDVVVREENVVFRLPRALAG